MITYRTRGALRDAGRALGFGSAQIDALTASLAWWDKREQLPERFADVGLDPQSPRVEKWLGLAEQLRGFPRHLSQHVGGFVISRGPLARLVPVENAAMAERTVIQWDKDDLDALGLMKVDILALGMLSAIRRMLDLSSEGCGRHAWKCTKSRRKTRRPTTCSAAPTPSASSRSNRARRWPCCRASSRAISTTW